MGDFGFLLLWHGSSLFLLYVYTDVLGINPAVAGAIYLAAMIWDAVSDPLVASWSERQAMRTGRYSPIIAKAALPLGLAYALIYFAPPLSGWSLAAWVLITHLAFRTAYTIASMPYNTLPIRLARSGRDRSALSGARVAGAALGALTTAIITPVLVQSLQAQGQSEQMGYQIAALIIGGLAALFLLACTRLVREGKTGEPMPPSASYSESIRAMFLAAAGNGPLIRLLLIMIGATLAQGFFLQNVLYYLTHVLNRADMITPVLAVSAFSVILGAPVWVWVATRTSKKSSLVYGMFLASAGYLLMALAPMAGNFIPLVSASIASIGGAAIPVMLWSMMPDAIEHGEVETGVRIEARTFGLAAFCQKTTVGLGAVIIGGVLSLSGYDPESTLPPSAVTALTLMIAWLPALIMSGLTFIIRTYPIDEARHCEILAVLDERKKRGV